ncbi:MAG: hypothetical protein AAF329_23655 [Cyanobacteria bacterium P01_A01_bin.17]
MRSQKFGCSPNANIIILTTDDTDKDTHKGRRGYVFKNTTVAELIGAMRTVHNGQRYIPPEVALKLAEVTTERESLLPPIQRTDGNVPPSVVCDSTSTASEACKSTDVGPQAVYRRDCISVQLQ